MGLTKTVNTKRHVLKTVSYSKCSASLTENPLIDRFHFCGKHCPTMFDVSIETVLLDCLLIFEMYCHVNNTERSKFHETNQYLHVEIKMLCKG